MTGMLRRFALVAALLMPAQLLAADGQKVIDGTLEPAGYEQVTDLTAAVGIPSIPDGVKLTLIQAEGDDLRWRDDGTSPTASVGMLLADGDTLVYNGDARALELIETTGSGIANVSYYR